MARKPIIALVGRPNVGKSTMFNRLVGERMAVTDNIPGTTRDRLQSEYHWRGVDNIVIDTGGIEVYQPKGTRDTSPLAEGSADFIPQIKAQALIAIQEADAVIMVVDSVHGITAADEEIAEILRRSEKPVFVAANKVDDLKRSNDAYDFFTLGVGPVVATSAYHGLGVGDLLDHVYEATKHIAEVMPDDAEADQHLRIAIVGRPNVGKSSLLNQLIGEDRVIVSPIAGTTRDAIDTELSWHGNRVTIIDTAGIRRRGKIEPGVEKFSVVRSMNALERADVALLMIDAVDGVTEQDQHIAGYVIEAHKSIVIVVNKWDAVEKDSMTLHNFEKELRVKFDFLPDPPIIFISAKTGQRIHEVLETAHRAWESRFFRIPTAELNRIVRGAVANHPPTVVGTKKLKILFVSQVAINPPVILFHVNDPEAAHFTYRRYLENQIREVYAFEGTPLRFSFRAREGSDKK